MKCPQDGCEMIFTDEQVQSLLSKSQYIKFKVLKHKKILNQNPNVRWCTRRGCDKHIIGAEGLDKIQCECGMQLCFKCGGDYHLGKTCDKMIDSSYKAYTIANKVQQCPKCRYGVEKADGCNHMTCW